MGSKLSCATDQPNMPVVSHWAHREPSRSSTVGTCLATFGKWSSAGSLACTRGCGSCLVLLHPMSMYRAAGGSFREPALKWLQHLVAARDGSRCMRRSGDASTMARPCWPSVAPWGWHVGRCGDTPMRKASQSAQRRNSAPAYSIPILPDWKHATQRGAKMPWNCGVSCARLGTLAVLGKCAVGCKPEARS